MNDFKNRLSGAFELVFLFGRGIKKFSGTREEAMQSLVIVCGLFLCQLVFAWYYPPKGMEVDFATPAILTTVSLHYIFSFLLGIYFVALVARHLKVQKYFWLFFTACNWTALALSIITLPLAVLGAMDVIDRAEADRIFALISMYGYLVTGCIAMRAFVINWYLAAAMSIGTLVISQELWRLFFYTQGMDMPW